jgi:DNA-binding NarL/FixJ family response regulator
MHILGNPVRVAVASPHALTREGLTSLLAGNDGRLSVVAVAAALTGSEQLHGADVLVYDLAATTDLASAELSALAPGPTPVVGLEVPGRGDLTEAALALGVVDVLPRSVSSEELVAAVERAAGGAVVTAASYRAAKRAAIHAGHGLTAREASILALVAAGLSNLEIAEELYLSINSVKTYIRTAYRRIGVRSRSEAVLWAVRHGLAEPDPRGTTEAAP